jgi:hypothetical protein
LSRYARTPLGAPLTESIDFHGQLLAEGLFDGLIKAFDWVKTKVSSGISSALEAAKSAGGKIFEATKKILILVIESIPGGKAALDMLTSFSAEIAEKIGSMINSAKENFEKWLSSVRVDMLGATLEAANESGVTEELANKKTEATLKSKSLRVISENQEGENILKKILDDPAAAAQMLVGGARGAAGQTIRLLIKLVFRKKPELIGILRKKFMDNDFMKSKAGAFLVRMINFSGLSLNAPLETLIDMASKLWETIKSITTGSLNVARTDRELINDKSFPDLIGSLVGGDSAIENIAKTIALDPEAIHKLISSSISRLSEAIFEKISGSLDELLGPLNITGPIAAGVKKVFSTIAKVGGGLAGGAAATSALS